MAQAGFGKLRSDAQAMEGSVFDTLFDKALRFGSSDPMGGLGPQAAVTGPAGPTAASWLSNMARRIAGNKPGQSDDLIQAAMEAVQREGGMLNPRHAMRQAKSTMLKAREVGGQGTRSSVARAISKAEGRVGTGGELRLWSETNKHLSKPISLEQFRQARSGIRQEPVSLDQPLTAEGRTTMGDRLQATDNPESAAILKQGLSRLTPAQQQNLLKRFQGEDVNPAILQRIQQKLRGGKDTPPPISGGSGTPNLQLSPMMQRTQELTQQNLDFLYPTGKVNQHWSAPVASDARVNRMLGVQNPQHADFLAMKQSNPNIARSLMRIDPETQVPVRFQDPRPGMDALGETRVGLGPNNPTTIRLNPARGAQHQQEVPIHEALHALYGKNRGLSAQSGPNPPSWAGDVITNFLQRNTPGYADQLTVDYLTRSQAPNPLGHAGLESMANQIARRAGQNPGLRTFQD